MNGSGGGLVSIVLPCYRAERFLAAALASLLGQTHADLEILALDDGSTDGTRAMLEAHAAADARIRILVNDTNQGLIATLNRGVEEARGAYIARMDADEVAHPERIGRQVAFLEAHPDVDVVGSASAVIDEGGRVVGRVPARCSEPGGARFMANFATPIQHPTLLARAEVMKAHPYGGSARALHTEDYELFSRMAAAGVRFANLPEVLLDHRVHATSVSRAYESLQVENFVACSLEHLRRTGVEVPGAGAHRVLVNRMTADTTPADLRAGLALLAELEAGFGAAEPAAAGEIHGIADEQRVDILVQAARRGSAALRLTALALAAANPGSFLSPRGRAFLRSKIQR